MRMRTSFAAAAVTAGLFGCATGVALNTAAAAVEDAVLTIDNFTFAPQRLTVKAGTTLTWTNQDDIPHTVVSTTQRFKSKALDTDGRFSFMFMEPGSYDYFCSLHPHMTGTIVVEAATGNAP
jgi:plastocyanin